MYNNDNVYFFNMAGWRMVQMYHSAATEGAIVYTFRKEKKYKTMVIGKYTGHLYGIGHTG